MTYRVIDKLQNNKVIETHGRWEDAYRALHIFTAHELKNGRKAHYAVEPEMIQAATPTLDELNLPSWAYQILAGEEQMKKAQTFLESGEARSGLVAPMAEHIKEMITPKPADEVAGDLVAKQVQEGKVVLGPDGEVLAHEVFMKKYAREGETLEDAKKRIAEEAKKHEPSDGARRAALRSPNHESMSAREQWEEDKQLGILDWDGD